MNDSRRYAAISAIGALVVAVIIIVLVLTLGHKSNQTLSGSQAASAKAQIENNWKTFFADSTTLSQRETLLQNGSQFNSVINEEFKALGSQKSQAVISSVSLTSATTAIVAYSIQLNGQTVLPNQTGQAVLSGGKWKVSQATFCQLLKMGGAAPPACQNIKGQ